MAYRITDFDYDYMAFWVVITCIAIFAISFFILAMEKTADAAPVKPKKIPRRNKPVSKRDDYSVVWIEQTKGSYRLNVTLRTDMVNATMGTQVRYLQNVFDQIFTNFIGGYYMGYRMVITYGDKSAEFSDFGCFTPAKLILFLLEMGLPEAYKSDNIGIDLLDMY